MSESKMTVKIVIPLNRDKTILNKPKDYNPIVQLYYIVEDVYLDKVVPCYIQGEERLFFLDKKLEKILNEYKDNTGELTLEVISTVSENIIKNNYKLIDYSI